MKEQGVLQTADSELKSAKQECRCKKKTQISTVLSLLSLTIALLTAACTAYIYAVPLMRDHGLLHKINDRSLVIDTKAQSLLTLLSYMNEVSDDSELEGGKMRKKRQAGQTSDQQAEQDLSDLSLTGLNFLRGPPGIPGRDGRDGPEGRIGSSGPKGSQGDRGPPGVRGERGETGINGLNGRDGPQGLSGPKGAQGSPGLDSEKGAKGESGSTGDRGLPGPKGIKGMRGEPGQTGEDGRAGLPGAIGHPGPPGAIGQKGATGATGHSGSRGLKGSTGATGRPGSKGEPGAKGERGIQGTQGAPGRAGSTGAVDTAQWNTKLSNITAEIAQIKASVSRQQSSGTSNSTSSGGSVYTRWGRTACSNSSTKLYSGVVGSARYDTIGGGVNFQCLPPDPELSRYNTRATAVSWMRSVEYESQTYGLFNDDVDNKHALCARCYTNSRPAVMMIPAKVTCPTGWTKEYSGFLMASGENEPHPSTYECVDSSPEFQALSPADLGGRFWFVNVDCTTGGSVGNCRRYINGRQMSCVVCSK